MTKRKKQEPIGKTQWVRYIFCLLGTDGIEAQYPYGWASAPKLASMDTVEERMDFLLSQCFVDDENVIFNGGTVVSRSGFVDGKFETVDSMELWDFTNGKDYFTDAAFQKVCEWSNEYQRQIDEEAS